MSVIYLSLPDGLTARISCNFALDAQTLLWAQAYVPGLNPAGKTRTADIRLRWNGRLSSDLWHLLYSMTRSALLKKSFFTVHGALVGNTLIVGHSGAGKTSILLDLLRAHGMKIFSGNKTVMSFKGGKLNAVAGTRTVTVRGPRGWKALKLAGKDYAPAQAVRIRNIVIARLNDGVKEFCKLEPLSALHTLYPYFLDTVNADTIVKGRIFDGTPPTSTRERLVAGLTKVLKGLPVYAVNGPKKFIVQKIAKF